MPTFEDIQKLMSFWSEQQDKFYYFEIESVESGERVEDEPIWTVRSSIPLPESRTQEVTRYRIQERIVGKIKDVLFFPPSLLLTDVSIRVTELTLQRNEKPLVTTLDTQEQDTYGLVMSRIHYFERIGPKDPKQFMEEAHRWAQKP